MAVLSESSYLIIVSFSTFDNFIFLPQFVFYNPTKSITLKSFLALLSLILRAIFLPGSKLFTCSDVKGTAIKITKQKLDEIFAWWPLLAKEVKSQKMSTDYIELEFKNGSIFSIVSMTSAGRGTRATAGRQLCPLAL